jgi:hypothetical protein
VETNLWVRDGRLFLVVTRFLNGKHYARDPGQFVRIIAHRQELHERGFVHGDIRGFNTVFSDTPDNCRLIDFDFGGDTTTTPIHYPVGYKPELPDGFRVGKGGKVIEKWHDWYALAYLLFFLHELVDPVVSGPRDSDLEKQYNAARKKWDAWLCDKKNIPTDTRIEELKIEELKSLLTDLAEVGFTFGLWKSFEDALDENNDPVATDPAATGSPQVKK